MTPDDPEDILAQFIEAVREAMGRASPLERVAILRALAGRGGWCPDCGGEWADGHRCRGRNGG